MQYYLAYSLAFRPSEIDDVDDPQHSILPFAAEQGLIDIITIALALTPASYTFFMDPINEPEYRITVVQGDPLLLHDVPLLSATRRLADLEGAAEGRYDMPPGDALILCIDALLSFYDRYLPDYINTVHPRTAQTAITPLVDFRKEYGVYALFQGARYYTGLTSDALKDKTALITDVINGFLSRGVVLSCEQTEALIDILPPETLPAPITNIPVMIQYTRGKLQAPWPWSVSYADHSAARLSYLEQKKLDSSNRVMPADDRRTGILNKHTIVPNPEALIHDISKANQLTMMRLRMRQTQQDINTRALEVGMQRCFALTTAVAQYVEAQVAAFPEERAEASQTTSSVSSPCTVCDRDASVIADLQRQLADTSQVLISVVAANERLTAQVEGLTARLSHLESTMASTSQGKGSAGSPSEAGLAYGAQ